MSPRKRRARRRATLREALTVGGQANRGTKFSRLHRVPHREEIAEIQGPVSGR
jgi:hypothetical protein